MKPNLAYLTFLPIIFFITGCYPLCDATIEKRSEYILVCNDKSNLIQYVSQTYLGDTVPVYNNAAGDDSVVWNVAIDKPNTMLIIKRTQSTDYIQYTLNVTKEFDPESPCADNYIVYKTDSIRIDATTCKNMVVNYVEHNYKLPFYDNFRGWIIQFN